MRIGFERQRHPLLLRRFAWRFRWKRGQQGQALASAVDRDTRTLSFQTLVDQGQLLLESVSAGWHKSMA
ncbi:hypothetical protein [Synechococcus sp. GEYO]|uniref:hypothetical protein n=1 Tax=Synechococcus sp. GEYO TaxID=2575511 RepID=UPI000E0EE6C5|nr:hypothetical protein [Synechococcus sp. GEYO]